MLCVAENTSLVRELAARIHLAWSLRPTYRCGHVKKAPKSASGEKTQQTLKSVLSLTSRIIINTIWGAQEPLLTTSSGG